MRDEIPDFMKEFDTGFGFEESNLTFVNKPTIELEKEIEQTAMKIKTKLTLLKEMILPFLVRLYKSNEDYIHWPSEQRKEILHDKIKQIIELTGEST